MSSPIPRAHSIPYRVGLSSKLLCPNSAVRRIHLRPPVTSEEERPSQSSVEGRPAGLRDRLLAPVPYHDRLLGCHLPHRQIRPRHSSALPKFTSASLNPPGLHHRLLHQRGALQQEPREVGDRRNRPLSEF